MVAQCAQLVERAADHARFGQGRIGLRLIRLWGRGLLLLLNRRRAA
jgi:hypothetical protein